MIFNLIVKSDYKLSNNKVLKFIKRRFLWLLSYFALSERKNLHSIKRIYWPFVAFYFHEKHKNLFSGLMIMESYRYKVSAIYLIARFSKGQYKRSSLKYMSLLEEFDILGRLLSEKDYLFFKENMCLEQNCLNWNLSLDIDPDKKIRVLGPLVTNYKEEDGYDSIIIKPERFYLDSNSRAFAYYNTEDFLFKLKDIIDLIESGAIKKVMTTNKDEYSKYWVTPAIPLPYDFIFSNPLALITIINTLLYHGYGEILLEGFNFYTGGPVYSDKYHSSVKTGTGSLNKEKFLESLCGHDLLLNYIILKSMTEYKVLYVDHHLKYIHETTPYEYIKKFEDGLYE